jgi:uncharacterized protein with ACT and thioredoxin-like domain
VFLIGEQFGSSAYGNLPSTLFGGEPAKIIIVFRGATHVALRRHIKGMKIKVDTVELVISLVL